MKTKLDKLIRFALLAPFVTAMVIYGSTKPKPGPNFSFDNTYIGDGGSYATNDTVHVALTRRIMELPIDDCDVIAYMRVRSSNSAADYVMLPTYTFGEYPVDFTVANATNYNYWFYLDYVPPSPVHTNGVFELRGFEVAGEPRVPNPIFSAGFAQSVSKILPPTAADYIQDGLIAMWDGIDHGNNPLIWRDLSGNGYDATQRVANAGWSWGDDCYIGTAQNGHGFRTPQALVDFFRSNITNHTIEIVYRPTASSRETILGQYYGSAVGLNLEYAPHQVGHFRVYWGASPDFNSPAWKTLGMVRMTTTMLCNGTNCQIYENGAYKALAAQPNVDRVGVQNLIIGGENSRSNMSIRGELCIVRIYSRALTAEEIAHNYKIDSIRFGLPGAPSAVVPLSPPSLPPPAQSLFSTLATENLTE